MTRGVVLPAPALRRALPFVVTVLLLPAVLLRAATGNAASETLTGADPCAGFSWNVTHERSLFAGHARRLRAGTDLSSAPRITTDRLYEATLQPQGAVRFPAPPGKQPREGDVFAGLLRLRVPEARLYRISADEPFWIDVIVGSQPLSAVSYQGRPGCHAPHKIVQFMLTPSQQLVVQLSGAGSSRARLTITRAPRESP